MNCPNAAHIPLGCSNEVKMNRQIKRLHRAMDMFHRSGTPIMHDSYQTSSSLLCRMYYVRVPVLAVQLKSGERIDHPERCLSKLYTPYAYHITRKNVMLLCHSNVAEYYFRYNDTCLETPDRVAVFAANYSRMLMIKKRGTDPCLKHGSKWNISSGPCWEAFQELPEVDE